MNWIQKIWPRRSKAKSKPEASGALVPSYGQDLQHPDELINRANKRAVKGDLEGAIADFDAAIELNPAKATTYYNRGYLNNLAGNHEQARQDCSEAIALLPDYDEAFYQRGVAHQELGDLDAAIVDLSEVLRLNAFSIKAYYKRASCYAAQDDVQGAVADYTQAILRVPKDANAYLQRGIFLTKLQEYRTAVADFASALSFNPKCADAYYHRGYCYAELGEKEKATQDFNQAMLYDPSQRVADYNRSYALGILKDTKNLPPASPMDVLDLSAPAVVQDDDAVVLSLSSDDPTILTAASSNALVQETLPDTPPLSVGSEPSPTSAPSASTVSPDLDSQPSGALVRQSEVEALFATAQYQAQAQDFEAAIATYSEILEVEPHNARAYFERGRSLNAIGRGDAAADDADKAVTLAKQKSLDLMKNYNSTLAETLADLKGGLEWEQHPASALVASNQQNNQSIEGAILKYSQLIHRNPLDVHAYFERAKSRAILGDLEGAIADYTRTIALDETYRDAYYKRGILLSALGDADGATRDMNKAILRKPLLPAAAPLASSVPLRESTRTPQPVSNHRPPSDVNEAEGAVSMDPDEPVARPNSTVIENVSVPERAAPAAATAVSQMNLPRDIEIDASSGASNVSEFAEKVEQIEEEEGLETDQKIETMKSTYISDLMLEPCTHEGNDPAHRFCIFCGQPIHSTQ